jgi:hypothetical protein
MDTGSGLPSGRNGRHMPARFTRLLVALGLLAAVVIACAAQLSAPADCGLSRFKAVEFSDFAVQAVVKKVAPKLPDEITREGVSGMVAVRVVVDGGGRVVATCAVVPLEGPVPHPALVRAARAAAAQWVFKVNFGLPRDVHPRMKYVQDVIVFRFSRAETG